MENLTTKQNNHYRNTPGKLITLHLPLYIINIALILKNAGYKAYLVGGALRDTLIGKTTQDYDISTDASPQQIQK